MTNRPDSNSEDSRPHHEDASPEAAAPPPPPETAQDDDVGLATEMVFSGEQRERLRNVSAYETLKTGELSFDDEELHQDVAAPKNSGDHQTELNVTADHPDMRDAAQASQAPATSTDPATNSAGQSEYGNYRAQSFEPTQDASQRTGTTNEPLALAMFIILTLAALGILGVLLWLVYRLLTGA